MKKSELRQIIREELLNQNLGNKTKLNNGKSIDEGIGTIAIGVAAGLVLLKLLKYVIKKVAGKIALNVNLPKENLHKILDTAINKALETKSNGAVAMNLMLFQNAIAKMIDSGEIKNAGQIAKAVVAASKSEPIIK